MERIIKLLQNLGHSGVIIPVASVCTDGYLPLQDILRRTGNLVISNFNDRPSKLFDGLEHIRLSIILYNKTVSLTSHSTFTTKYNRWQAIERPNLFHQLAYTTTIQLIRNGSIPKLRSQLESNILKKLLTQTKTLNNYEQKASKENIYYTRKLSGFVQILDFIPLIYNTEGKKREPSELKRIGFDKKEIKNAFLALFNSNLFYWFLTVHSDCRNLNKREIYAINFDFERASSQIIVQLIQLSQNLMQDFAHRSKLLEMKYENLGRMTIQCIYPRHSKPIIDEIDRVLARHYGFTDEELDFIINYDIKYRMGRDNGDEGED